MDILIRLVDVLVEELERQQEKQVVEDSMTFMDARVTNISDIVGVNISWNEWNVDLNKDMLSFESFIE